MVNLKNLIFVKSFLKNKEHKIYASVTNAKVLFFKFMQNQK